ncbi:hypothetical protein VKT23_005299 [Stygiomarasmius scandens]|uniref:Uncharacterized protein n=1 Tax=Marasmiellus scandens TaxID=2682957 RepID=A0ABR1JQP0_9AGAR
MVPQLYEDDSSSFLDVDDDHDAHRISISSTAYAGSENGSVVDDPPISFSMDTSTTKPPVPKSRKPDHLLALSGSRLQPGERADLVRRSKKLTQVFGQTPGVCVLDSSRGHRAAFSISNDRVWGPADNNQTIYLSASSSRRHSTPLTPEELDSFRAPSSDSPNGGQTSFIDLSDGESRIDDDSHSDSTVHDDSFLDDHDDSDDGDGDPDEERRRKRDKLAKLHRFLGSRVPTDLVLGRDPDYSGPETDLPPIVPLDINLDNMNFSHQSDDDARKAWLRRRRSSSAAAFPERWSDDLDRLKEDLGDEEKKINVRRAHKMEQVFGVAPPQTLYHTRQGPSPSVEAIKRSASGNTDMRNVNQSAYIHKSGNNSRSGSASGKPRKKEKRPGSANSDNSTQQLLDKSEQQELDYGTISSSGYSSTFASGAGSSRRTRGASLVYTHYQHSLNSLNDILDRDDRESLAELHDYLNSTDIDFDLHERTGRTEAREHLDHERDASPVSPIEFSNPSPRELKQYRDYTSPKEKERDRRMSNASLRSERRRSLPLPTSPTAPRMSVLSAGSIGSINSFGSATDDLSLGLTSPGFASSGLHSPTASVHTFQQRRRRAAKLTQFFGVNYRELIRDVLESIENGLERERRRGTMQEEEVEDLLQKLRTLKSKRSGVY